MIWILKAIMQKSISFLPECDKVNMIFQKYVTRRGINDGYFSDKVASACEHVKIIKKNFTTLSDLTVLELGTGWFPVIPIFIYLNDCGKVKSFDIYNWMTKGNIVKTINIINKWKLAGKLDRYFNSLNKNKYERLLNIANHPDSYSIDEIKKEIGLNTYVRDICNSGLQNASIDFICSNNTFEHIYPEFLEKILKEFKRVLKPAGMMHHWIDLTDHFEHLDKSISCYNFLKFSKTQWAIIDNKIQPQNRMRFKDYLSLYEKLGIPANVERIMPGDISLLLSVKPHKEYSSYTRDELAITHGALVSKFS